jgi:hypothetical protein
VPWVFECGFRGRVVRVPVPVVRGGRLPGALRLLGAGRAARRAGRRRRGERGPGIPKGCAEVSCEASTSPRAPSESGWKPRHCFEFLKVTSSKGLEACTGPAAWMPVYGFLGASRPADWLGLCPGRVPGPAAGSLIGRRAGRLPARAPPPRLLLSPWSSRRRERGGITSHRNGRAPAPAARAAARGLHAVCGVP